eukprot:gene12923-biopygen7615
MCARTAKCAVSPLPSSIATNRDATPTAAPHAAAASGGTYTGVWNNQLRTDGEQGWAGVANHSSVNEEKPTPQQYVRN